METLKQYATKYEPKKTANVTDLLSLSISEPIEERQGRDDAGKDFSYMCIVRDGVDYRIAPTVIGQIKALLEEMPNLDVVRVSKKGEGLNTRYTVIPMVR